MIKKYFPLEVDKSLEDTIPPEIFYHLSRIRDVYTSEEEYIEAADRYASYLKISYGFTISWQELFGEPKEYGIRVCTDCGWAVFPHEGEHECKAKR